MTPTLAAFALLQAGDVLTTQLAIGVGAHEGNPVAAALLQAGGMPALALAKAAVIVAAALVVVVMPISGHAAARFTLQLASVAMAFVVLSNAGLWLR